MQNDWPNPSPPRKQSGEISIAVNLLLTVLAGAAVVPREPIYTPLPAQKARIVDAAPNLLLTTLAPSAQAPFSQDDWATPTKRLTPQADVSPNLLTTVLAPAAATTPVSRGSGSLYSLRPAVQAQQWTAPNLLLTTLASAPFSQDDWQNPSVRRSQQPEFAPNLLGTTLAPAQAAIPFSQDDWPNPGRRPAQRADAQPNLLTGVLAPAAPTLIPRAPLYAQRPAVQEQQAWIDQNLLLTTLGTSQPAGAPFSQDDWPPPAKPKIVRVDLTPNLLSSTLGPTLQPFAFEWDSPTQAKRARPDAQPNLLTGALAPAQVAPPFKPYDWSPPRAAAYKFEQPWPVPLALRSPGAAPVPFNQDDWQQLTRAPRAPQVDGAANLLRTTLAAAPFRQTDWTNPVRLARLQGEYLPRNTVCLTTPPPTFQAAWAKNVNTLLGPGRTA